MPEAERGQPGANEFNRIEVEYIDEGGSVATELNERTSNFTAGTEMRIEDASQ